MKQRFEFIDWMKAFGIFLVVLGHQPLTNEFLRDYIFSFHIPLFFFISGFLYHAESNQKVYIKRNARQLLLVIIPYFLIGMAFSATQDYVFYRSDFSLQHNLYNKLENLLLGKSTMGVMWFLIALFNMRIVYNFCRQKIKNHGALTMLTGSFIFALLTYSTGFDWNYYQLTATILGLPFYSAGAYIKEQQILDKLSVNKKPLIWFITCSALLLILIPVCGHIDLNALSTGNNIILYYIIGLSGIVSILSLSILLPKHKIIETISQGTLVILGLHMMIIQIFKLAYKKLCGISTPPPYMDSLSAILISLTIIILLYRLIIFTLHNNHSWIRFFAGKR